MNNEKSEERQNNPRQTANIFSRITFWYTYDLFKTGFKRELEEKDLYDVLPEFNTSELGDRMEREWNEHKKDKNAMFLVLWKMYGKYYCILSVTMLFTIILNVIRPIIIGKVVSFFTPGEENLSRTPALLYVVFLLVLQLVDVVCKQNYLFMIENLGIKIRSAFCSLIYRKFLKLPVSRLRYITFGNVANLITRDISAFDQFFINFTYAWSGFIVAMISCYNMYRRIGLPAVVAVLAFAILIPLQVFAGIWIASLKKQTSKKTDTRLTEFREACSNIRSIKMYVWENYLESKISWARKREMNILFKIFALLFLSILTGIIVNNVTFYLVVMTNIWTGQVLTAEIMYYISGTFQALSATIQVAFPYATFSLPQVFTAIKRMQTLAHTLEMYNQLEYREFKTNKPKVEFSNVKVTIDNKTVFANVTLHVYSGLILISGPAGSGKSVFLLTILREFEVSEGNLLAEGKLSYASQEPWLFPATIKQNILFGNNYNHEHYQEVLRVCDLHYDLDLLENGDSTIVVDGGVNLSKGQRSRINLARAIYQNSDIYLIDDCLSSLDPLVADHIFKNCILKLLRDKLVFLVSHYSDLSHYATNIVNLRNGNVTLWKHDLSNNVQNDDQTIVPNMQKALTKSAPKLNSVDCERSKLIETTKTNKVYRELKVSGSVPLKTYMKYVGMGGGCLTFSIIFFIFILAQLLVSYKDKLLSNWVNFEDKISRNNLTVGNTTYSVLIEDRNQLLRTYTIVVVGISVATLIRGCALFLFSRKVSITLHKKMLNCVINTSINFFDSTFLGNIVNRFSKDLDSVDESIPFPLHHLIVIILEILGNIVLIAFTNVRLLLPIALLFGSLIFLRYIYIKTGAPLKRLDASTKSPVIGYLSATLEGLPTIKAFSCQGIVKEEFETHHNLYNSASYSHAACLKAFVFVVDTLASIFIVVVILQFVILEKDVLPGDVGLAISQAFTIYSVFFYGVYKWVDLETQMTSAERAMEYTTIQKESKSGLEIDNWPTLGEIKYENVYLSVDNSKSYVLKNLNFHIKPNEKLGIVGRTGAGKSSIISALFRLYEIKGRITIDGVDIKTLSLDFLRSNISVIPQDPFLLRGTLRYNIDPDQVHTDEEIWTALNTVGMNKIISILNANIKEFEFSCSQKRLLCLARVLMKNKKILAIDEIVEHVDTETEDLIYKIIDEHFKFCTVIKIAHRLKFIMDCDKVLVMDNGNIVEYDNPEILLKNINGNGKNDSRLSKKFPCDRIPYL
ncbi:ATP-binding cassette sub-family C member 4-like [Zophobas morio]|uniref:ATP-binding cassette sub-family C member 4-like n=1 Tax=Zophobas morio TaxID=2755281 RepID=UPI003082A882